MLRVCKAVARPALANSVSRPALTHVAPARRTYVTTTVYTRDEVALKVSNLRASIQGANWADYLVLVQNVPFWEAELEKVTTAATPFLADPDMGKDMDEIYRTLDVLYATEDVRDHLNELMEVGTRSSGMMGVGLAAGEKVENMDEVVEGIIGEYEDLLKRYPDFKPKIEMTVGHGLALLRQKNKFRFPSMHRFFF